MGHIICNYLQCEWFIRLGFHIAAMASTGHFCDRCVNECQGVHPPKMPFYLLAIVTLITNSLNPL